MELPRPSRLGKVAPGSWLVTSSLGSSLGCQGLKTRGLSSSRGRRDTGHWLPPQGSRSIGEAALLCPVNRNSSGLLQRHFPGKFCFLFGGLQGALGHVLPEGCLQPHGGLSRTGVAVPLSTVRYTNLGHLPDPRNTVLKGIMIFQFHFTHGFEHILIN